MAKSWWGGTKNLAHNDIVHLNPSNAEANNRKSNYPISELQTVKWDNGVTFVGVPKSGQGGGSSWGYEPADEYKGDFARVFMYMFCTYWDLPWQDNTAWMYSTSGNHELKEWAYELMIRWSNSDPVSEKERNRNDGVQQEQRNRNPFIDLPDLADHIWGDKKNEPYKVEGSGEDPEDPEGTTAIFNWLGENDADGSAGWDFDNTNLPSDLDYIWSWKEYNGKYYLNASAYKGGNSYKAEAYAWSEPVNMTNAESATFSFEHAAKFQTTLRTLCKVAVKDVATGEVTLVDIPNYPNSGVWTFAQSGDIDLTGFVGKNIRVGFRYGSEDGAADTWEIKNAKLTVKQTPSGVELMPDPDAYDDSEMVEVWGNNILVPEGAVIYNLSGVAVNGENLPRGIYVVTKPSFSKAVKVMIK